MLFSINTSKLHNYESLLLSSLASHGLIAAAMRLPRFFTNLYNVMHFRLSVSLISGHQLLWKLMERAKLVMFIHLRLVTYLTV